MNKSWRRKKQAWFVEKNIIWNHYYIVIALKQNPFLPISQLKIRLNDAYKWKKIKKIIMNQRLKLASTFPKIGKGKQSDANSYFQIKITKNSFDLKKRWKIFFFKKSSDIVLIKRRSLNWRNNRLFVLWT